APSTRVRRRWRNYLLNPRFQLKYTGLLVFVVLAVMVALGLVIWRTSSIASNQAQFASAQAERALKESATSARIIRMSAAAYGNAAPDLEHTLAEELTQIDREYEKNLREVAERRAAVEALRRRMLHLLVGGGVMLLVLLSVLGIFITHRI